MHKIIAEYISACERNGERVRPSELFEILGEDSPEFNEILDLNYGDKLSGPVAERFFGESLQTLEEEGLQAEIDECKKRFEAETDTGRRKEIARRLDECMRRLKKRGAR